MAKEGQKFEPQCIIPLGEIQLRESGAACGINDARIFHDKPEGLRITDIGRGVLVERPGFADVLLYPSTLKRAIALTDIDLSGCKAPKSARRLAK